MKRFQVVFNAKKAALAYVVFLLFLAAARDFIANGRPLYCRIDGQNYYPGLRALYTNPQLPTGIQLLDSIEQNDLWPVFNRYESVVFAPIPFSADQRFMRNQLSLARPGTRRPGMPPH